MSKIIRTVCKEGICPVCGGEVDYTDAGPDYTSWTCNHCNATGDEGADITATGDKIFDGYHYNIVDGEGNPVDILDHPLSAIGFDFNGINVVNPLYDETRRFEVDPVQYYGAENINNFLHKLLK